MSAVNRLASRRRLLRGMMGGGAIVALRQPSVALLVGWQFLRTVFWGAASMSIPYWLNRLGAANAGGRAGAKVSAK